MGAKGCYLLVRVVGMIGSVLGGGGRLSKSNSAAEKEIKYEKIGLGHAGVCDMKGRRVMHGLGRPHVAGSDRGVHHATWWFTYCLPQPAVTFTCVMWPDTFPQGARFC